MDYWSFPKCKHSCDAGPEYYTIAKVDFTLHYRENRPQTDPCNNISYIIGARI